MRESLKNVIVTFLLAISTCGSVLADELLRDPTRPYTAAQLKAIVSPRYVVNAIIVSSDRRVAIVNGRRVGIGGSIGNATVVAIEKDRLILEANGERITARLHGGATR